MTRCVGQTSSPATLAQKVVDDDDDNDQNSPTNPRHHFSPRKPHDENSAYGRLRRRQSRRPCFHNTVDDVDNIVDDDDGAEADKRPSSRLKGGGRWVQGGGGRWVQL